VKRVGPLKAFVGIRSQLRIEDTLAHHVAGFSKEFCNLVVALQLIILEYEFGAKKDLVSI
jgi:hypothetical protein